MSKKQISTVMITILLVAAITAWINMPVSVRAADGGGDVAAAVQKLTERITALEVTVVRDPFRPKDTVLSRLEVVEEKLKDFGKAGATDAKGEQRSFEELRKAMEKVQKQNDELDRKLKALAQDRPDGGDGAVAKAVKEMQGEVDGLQRGLDDLKARVAKLENKR